MLDNGTADLLKYRLSSSELRRFLGGLELRLRDRELLDRDDDRMPRFLDINGVFPNRAPRGDEIPFLAEE